MKTWSSICADRLARAASTPVRLTPWSLGRSYRRAERRGHADPEQPRRAQHADRADGRRDHRGDGRDRGRRGGRARSSSPGTPPAFCAGANLGNLAEADGDSLGTIYEGFLRIARSPLPTLAAVNGAAVGAGMNLALGCDVRIAARRAKFDTRFLQLGLHPGGGHTWMLRRIAGPQAAMAAVVFGEVLDGAGGRARRARVSLRRRRRAARRGAGDGRQRPRRAARAGDRARSRRSRPWPTSTDHPAAVERELEPQLWSTRQPWFAERLAALQAKISTKP